MEIAYTSKPISHRSTYDTTSVSNDTTGIKGAVAVVFALVVAVVVAVRVEVVVAVSVTVAVAITVAVALRL